MIYIDRTITIKRNEAKIKEPIVLYRGDMNIELRFTIENNPFQYKPGMDVTYGQLIIKRPKAEPVFSEPVKMSSSKVIFIVTGDMIDGLEEEGDYDFQIQLLNTDQTSRGSLPPVTAGIIIRKPLCEPAAASRAAVNSRSTFVMRATNNDEGEAFDDMGNYNMTTWSSGDIITDTNLNKIEGAIYTINDNVISDYASREYVDDMINLNNVSLEDIYIKAENLDNYATQDYVTESISNIGLEDYASRDYVNDVITSNNANIEEYVDNAIENIEIPDAEVDLTGYATKEYVNSAIEAIELIPGPQGEQGIQGEQGPQGEPGKDADPVDLTGYATEEYVNNKCSEVQSYIDERVDEINSRIDELYELINNNPEEFNPEVDPYIVATFRADDNSTMLGEPCYSWQYSFDEGASWHNCEEGSETEGHEVIYFRPIDKHDTIPMYRLFENSTGLIEAIDFNNFSDYNINPDIDNMFAGCSSVECIDLTGINHVEAENMGHMFSDCSSLREIYLTGWDISDDYVWTNGLFSGCNSLEYITLRDMNATDVNTILSRLIDIDVPDNCEVIINIPSSDIDAGILEEFEGKGGILTQEEPGSGSGGAEQPPIGPEDPGERPEPPEQPEDPEMTLYEPYEFRERDDITEVNTIVNGSHDNLEEMFSHCYNLTSVNSIDWDTSNVRNMRGMFDACESLRKLEVSTWCTDNVENMECMFNDCTSLERLTVNEFNTEKVTNMSRMFNNCTSLSELNGINNWCTDNVENMERMFNFCSGLSELSISNWNTERVTNMSHMFTDSAINQLDLYNWNVDNVENMENMFGGCGSLETLNLSSWSINDITSVNNMLENCNSLRTLYLVFCSNETISKIINSEGFPTGTLMGGETRIIHCLEKDRGDLEAPKGWEFIYKE